MKKVEYAAMVIATAFTELSTFFDFIAPTKLDDPEARKILEIIAPINKYRRFICGTVLSGGAQTPANVKDFLIFS